MELDELKGAWASYDKKLSANLRLNEELLRSISFEKFNHAMKKPMYLELLNIVIQFLAVMMLIVITIRLSSEMPYLLLGIFSALVCTSSLVFSVVKAIRFGKLQNYDVGITEFQKDFTRLRIFIMRLRKIEYVLAALIGITLFPLMLKAVLGIDLLGNLIFVLVGIFCTIGVGYAVGTWLNLFIYDKGLKDAELFLRTIKKYDEES